MKKGLVLATVGFVATQAWAGTISMQITHGAQLAEGQLRSTLKIENRGDEAALGVTPVLRFRGAEARAATHDTLPPGQPLELELSVPAGPLAEGRWTYEVLVDYGDANLYPSQAVGLGTLVIGTPPLPKLSVAELGSVVLADETELVVRLKNVSAEPQQVGLRVLMPEAIEVGHDGQSVELPAWGEREVAIELTNRAALPGSSYPLFVAVEYDDGAVHQSVTAQTLVEIRPVDAYVGPRGTYLWIAAAICAALFVALLGWRLVKR